MSSALGVDVDVSGCPKSPIVLLDAFDVAGLDPNSPVLPVVAGAEEEAEEVDPIGPKIE